MWPPSLGAATPAGAPFSPAVKETVGAGSSGAATTLLIRYDVGQASGRTRSSVGCSVTLHWERWWAHWGPPVEGVDWSPPATDDAPNGHSAGCSPPRTLPNSHWINLVFHQFSTEGLSTYIARTIGVLARN